MASDSVAGLLGRSFRVAAIDGVPTLPTPVADLEFGADGRVVGCATVNRLFGPYTLDGATLTCGPLAGTMMAGPPEAMDQEQRLHRALDRPLKVVVTGDGSVELREGDAVAILLEPNESTELL